MGGMTKSTFLAIRVDKETLDFVRGAKLALGKSQQEIVIEALRMYREFLTNVGIAK